MNQKVFEKAEEEFDLIWDKMKKVVEIIKSLIKKRYETKKKCYLPAGLFCSPPCSGYSYLY